MKCYQIDAFAERVFEGNPAAVCLLDEWLPDGVLQNIAMENNLSETAFAVRQAGGAYHLRWFTPAAEVDLCGHATLAAAFAIAGFAEPQAEIFHFDTLSGRLTVTKQGGRFEMDFPEYPLERLGVSREMAQAFGAEPLEAWMGRDLVCVFDSEATVRTLAPDYAKLARLGGLLQHATAAGTAFDCVSRSFAPKIGIAEDPVCGSAHCHIAPLWAEKLGKTQIAARQASARGGTLWCEIIGNGRVKLAGSAVLYSVSELFV